MILSAPVDGDLVKESGTSMNAKLRTKQKKINYIQWLIIFTWIIGLASFSHASPKLSFSAVIQDGTENVVIEEEDLIAEPRLEHIQKVPHAKITALEIQADKKLDVQKALISKTPAEQPVAEAVLAPSIHLSSISATTDTATTRQDTEQQQELEALKKRVALLEEQLAIKPTTVRPDKVPAKHLSDFAERLKLTHEILKRYGYAIDYRTTKVGELKVALAQLEAREQKKNQSTAIQ